MNQLEYRRLTQLAQDFLARCFASGEFIALSLRRENPVFVTQRVVPLERAIAPRYLGWLAHENSAGANIYVAANPLRSGTRKRTKESVASVRHLYLDIDSDGEAKLAALQNSDSVPKPTAIISASPNKYQVLWRVEGFDFENQERTLKLLAFTFGGDPACTDCNRVLRVPGFFNLKYNPAHLVSVQYPVSDVSDFRLDISAPNPMTSKPHIAPRERTANQSNSEHDWAWVLHELASEKDPLKLTRELASRRSDKASPLYYAQRTVDVASARLWLLEGIRLDEVVTMLEVRRRVRGSKLHLLCSRARDCSHCTAHDFTHETCLIPTPRRTTCLYSRSSKTRQISASIRLDEATAAQVDQYVASIHATADDVVDKALNYVFSKDRDFQEFLKTSLAGSSSAQPPYPHSCRCRCCRAC